MSAKTFLPGALILAILGAAAGQAQTSDRQTPGASPGPDKNTDKTTPPGELPKDDKTNSDAAPTAPMAPAGVLTTGPSPSPNAGWISPWIAYSRPDCCQNCGADGPIESEYYYRTGLSQPIATGILHEAVQGGWINEIGARSLFFNKAANGAWTVDVGLSYTYNNGNEGARIFNQRINFNPNPTNPAALQVDQVETPVTIRGYHRTSANLGFGREWYLFQPATCPGKHWRVGFDSGGRWGASRVDLNDLGQLNNPPDPNTGNTFIGYKKLYDVFGAWFVSLHTDVEIPFHGCCVLTGGFRAEWNYNWSDVFSNEKGDLQDVNLMFQVGIRY